MSVSINPRVSLTAVETYTTDAAPEFSVEHSGFDQSGLRLTSASTPPVTKVSYQEYALVAGTKTIDLTALLNFIDVAQDCTGLKVQTLIFINPAGNASMNIAPGGSNPYPLFGTGNDVDVPAHATVDAWLAFFLPDGLADVAAGAKEITVTGTGTETFKLGLVLG